MNYSLFKHKKDDDSSVYIRASVSRAGRKSKVTIEKYDSIRLLDEKYGSWEKFIKERISVLEQQKRDLRKKARTITLDYSQSIDEHGLSFLKNAGYLLLQKVYYSLGIDQFIYHYKNNRNLKFEYSLNDVMRLLVFSRIISPASKLRTTQDAQSYLENFDVTLSDVYDGLTRIADFRGALQKYLYDKVRKILPPSDDVIYYDVTNFYYEIEDENEVVAYGVEKNHRPDPITSFGLFMDSNGVPIRYSDYRGNINESKQILPEWKELREETLNQDNSYIICTDAGLNSANLKYYCITRGDHYLFSQSVKKLAKDTLEDVFKEDGWVSMGDGRSYKVIKTIKNASVTDSTSTRKDGKKNKEMDTMYVIFFDPKRRDYILEKIEDRISRAKEIISKPASYDKVSSCSGKQYIEKLAFDENGCIIESESVLSLREDLIAKEKKFAGYGGLVTDMLDRKPEELIAISSRRWEIEDCFRQMKTGFSTRPVYLRRPDHIHAHFMTCYVSLMIMKLLEKKYLRGMSAERIFSLLRTARYHVMDDTGDIVAVEMSEDAVKAFRKMHLDQLLYTMVSNQTLKGVIRSTKVNDC